MLRYETNFIYFFPRGQIYETFSHNVLDRNLVSSSVLNIRRLLFSHTVAVE